MKTTRSPDGEKRNPGSAPFVSSVFNFNFGCVVSLGFGAGGLTGMKYSLPRLVGGITGQLFHEDRDEHFDSLARFDVAEF